LRDVAAGDLVLVACSTSARRPRSPAPCGHAFYGVPRWPPSALSAAHVNAVEALVTLWRGQRGVDLPGHVRARREAGRVVFRG
jgi:hypothetical protein